MAHIIVLEDEIATRRLIVGVLKTEGHLVTEVDNGAEGLLMVMAELPDLVVSDVEMPKLTGFEVLQAIRQEPDLCDTPVILLTSRSSSADIREGMNRGANDYLTKPFEPERLLQSVREQLAFMAAHRGGSQEADIAYAATLPAELAMQPLERTVQRVRPRQAMGRAWALSLQVLEADRLQTAMPLQTWRALLRELFVPGNQSAALKAANLVDLQGARLTLYFLDDPAEVATTSSGAMPTQVRMALALEAGVQACAHASRWASSQLQSLNLPPIRCVVSAHLGSIETEQVPLDYGGYRTAVVGDMADLAASLRDGMPPVRWRVLATQEAIQASPHVYRLGAQMDLHIGYQETQAYAVQGLSPQLLKALGREGDANASDWL